MTSLLFTLLPRPVRRVVLRYVIWETERYLADCTRTGIFDSHSLREVRAQLAQDRVDLALLEPATPKPVRKTA